MIYNPTKRLAIFCLETCTHWWWSYVVPLQAVSWLFLSLGLATSNVRLGGHGQWRQEPKRPWPLLRFNNKLHSSCCFLVSFKHVQWWCVACCLSWICISRNEMRYLLGCEACSEESGNKKGFATSISASVLQPYSKWWELSAGNVTRNWFKLERCEHILVM